MSNATQAINELDQTINSFKSRIDIKINDVTASTSNIRETTDKIYDNIGQFKTDMLHGEQKQIAHENILRIDQLIKEQFDSYTAVRRTVMGVVRDFDINLVRNSTIRELSEELWLSSSRYWLSYALLALTAWVNDYPEAAENALAECGRRDPVKTTLFFCLTNLRFGRNEAAKKWFCEYFNTVDPRKLQQETAVLLQAYLCGIFGADKELEDRVSGLIDRWVDVINGTPEISDELLRGYSAFIAQRRTRGEFAFTAISQFCSNKDEIEQSFFSASKLDAVSDFVKSLDVKPDSRDDGNYKSRVDAVLVNLISNYDAEELEMRRQQAYYRFVVENEGETDKAEAQYEAMVSLEDKGFNIGKQMLKWAIYDDDQQTNVQVRKFGFRNTGRWFVEAVNGYASELRDRFPQQYKLNIDTWSGVSTGDDAEEQTESLKAHFGNNRFRYMFMNFPNILAAALVIVSAGLAFLSLFSLIVTGIAGGFLAYRIVKAVKEYPKRVDAALENLNNVLGEIAEFRRVFEEKLALKDKIISDAEFI